MSLIYEPRGPAREYAARAMNHYKGCSHRCTYCYAPAFAYMMEPKEDQQRQFNAPRVGGPPDLTDQQRADRIRNSVRNAAPRHANGPRVLMCFTCDPYQDLEDTHHLTHDIIEILGEAGVPMTILTKNTARARNDFDLFVKYGVTLATTICWTDDASRNHWEQNASPIEDRFAILDEARELGLDTWVSLEPIIDYHQALGVVERLIGRTGVIKIGVVDRRWSPAEHDAIEWYTLGEAVLGLLEPTEQPYYIKDGLWALMAEEAKERHEKVRGYVPE